MTEVTEIKITDKSTKAQIKEAYDAAIAEVKRLRSMNDSPVEKAKADAMEATMENAERAVENPAFAPEIIAQYNDLKTAISKKSEELRDLYGIEAEAGALAAVINAHKVKKMNLEDDFAQRKADIDAQLTSKKAEVAEQISALGVELQKAIKAKEEEKAEYQRTLTRDRKREQEQYDYDLAVARKKDADQWADIKAKREAEIKAKEDSIVAREEAVSVREQKMNEMEAKIAEIPTLIADAEEKAAKTAKEKAEKSFVFERRSLTTEKDHLQEMANAEINRLREQVEMLTKTNKDLESKLDSAYSQMKELAATTVQAGATVKVVSSESK